MKINGYVRIGKPKKGGARVAMNVTPSHRPLTNSRGDEIPTVGFAVEFEIPDDAFKRAEKVIATLVVPDPDIAAEVRLAP